MKLIQLQFILLNVLAFIALSSQSPSDVKVKLNNLAVGSLARDVRWINGKVILAISMRENPPKLYRSANGGVTWDDQSSKILVAPAQTAVPQFIYANSVNSSLVYVRSRNHISWVTYDAGETWQVITPGAGYVNLAWHPYRAEWAIAQNFAGGQMPTISVTQDFGQTWKSVIQTYGDARYSWGDAGQPNGDVPPQRIYMVAPPTDPASDHPDFIYTDDLGGSRTVVHDKVYDFVFLEKQVIILAYVPTLADIVLRVTPDLGDSHKIWYDSEFPFGKEVPINGYTLLDDHTGAIYLGLNHEGPNSRYGNVYVSDSVGVHYFPSQSHVYTYSSVFDFERVHTLNGIYVSNTLQNWRDSHSTRADDEVQTFITMDNGDTWNLIKAPHFDSQGNPIVCTGIDCALHLHCYVGYITNLIGPFYSVEQSPGLVIANGNVGSYLSQQREETNTFISRDGGANWIEVMKGPTIYEIGDHGGIIVMAPLGVSTQYAYFTLDFGKTVYNVSLTAPIDVYNIIAEPSSTGEHFLLMGYQGTTPVVVGMDFSSVFPRDCVTQDYEDWSPPGNNINGKNCLLGQDITYTRRKSDANCYNNEVIDHIKSIEYCQCTWDDWECELGYHRNGTVCVSESAPESGVPANCHPGKQYNITKGYRPVPGTACQGGLQLWGEGPYDCPDPAARSKAWIAAAVLVPLVVVILIIVGAFFAIRSEKLREKLPFLNRVSNWKVGYLGLNTKPDTFDEDEDIFERREDVETHTIEDEDQILPVSAPAALDDDNFNPRA
eukprot:TRINITY_DN678_c0_g1_i1.p1 TRINITY_DN678_c0_g1~~TRINITY_DN678_c0_g1_i1.p1  ORF type:complete len:774 (-),score=177.48 TRINITY_DN678_c0_g1_i1:106-2427(-)